MLILPRLTDDLEIRGEMKRCNSFSPTSHFPHLLLLFVIRPQWVRTIDMRGTQRQGGGGGESKPSCLQHRPHPFNLHFIMVTSAVGPKALTPSLATKAVSSNI